MFNSKMIGANSAGFVIPPLPTQSYSGDMWMPGQDKVYNGSTTINLGFSNQEIQVCYHGLLNRHYASVKTSTSVQTTLKYSTDRFVTNTSQTISIPNLDGFGDTFYMPTSERLYFGYSNNSTSYSIGYIDNLGNIKYNQFDTGNVGDKILSGIDYKYLYFNESGVGTYFVEHSNFTGTGSTLTTPTKLLSGTTTFVFTAMDWEGIGLKAKDSGNQWYYNDGGIFDPAITYTQNLQYQGQGGMTYAKDYYFVVRQNVMYYSTTPSGNWTQTDFPTYRYFSGYVTYDYINNLYKMADDQGALWYSIDGRTGWTYYHQIATYPFGFRPIQSNSR